MLATTDTAKKGFIRWSASAAIQAAARTTTSGQAGSRRSRSPVHSAHATRQNPTASSGNRICCIQASLLPPAATMSFHVAFETPPSVTNATPISPDLHTAGTREAADLTRK